MYQPASADPSRSVGLYDAVDIDSASMHAHCSRSNFTKEVMILSKPDFTPTIADLSGNARACATVCECHECVVFFLRPTVCMQTNSRCIDCAER